MPIKTFSITIEKKFVRLPTIFPPRSNFCLHGLHNYAVFPPSIPNMKPNMKPNIDLTFLQWMNLPNIKLGFMLGLC